MASESALLMRVLGTCVSATHGACSIVRQILSSGQLGVVEKTGKNDLQTEADRSAQRSIVGRLQHQFPGIAVIGEEDVVPDAAEKLPELDATATAAEAEVLGKTCPDEWKEVKENEVVVWVDPLDGTNEFTQGLLDHVTVLVGVAVGGRPVAGVVAQPYFNYKEESKPLGRVVWGMRGLGVHNLEVKAPPADSLVVTTTRSHGTGIVDKAISALAPKDVLRVGGSGHKVLLLMEGHAHAYVFASKGTKKWDTCAPELLLDLSGGKMTDLLGEQLPYGKDVIHGNNAGLFATAKAEDHAPLIAKMPQEVRDHFKQS